MNEFDIIVIGGGSAGCAVAGRLSEDASLSVCLIEAGGRNNGVRVKTPGFMPFLPKNTNWQFDTVPQPGLNGRTGYQPRGRGLGGSSAINAMVYIRGNAWDYDNWEKLGATGWSHKDVLPWFRRSEANARAGESVTFDAHHGGDGPLSVVDQQSVNPCSHAFVEAASRLQLPLNTDFNGASQDGFGIYQTTQKSGERWSASRAYVEPVRDRANLDVRTHALVRRIIIENGRARGVEYERAGQVVQLFARFGVVLSAGAFGSPQILQLSGIGPAAMLKQHGIPVIADRAQVGENLQDHIDYVAGFATKATDSFGNSLTGVTRMARAVVEHRRKRTGILTTCWAEAGGFWKMMPDAPVPDVQFHFVPALLEDHGRENVKGHGFSCHVCVLRPESTGTVTLNSADPAAPPRIDPNFLADERDMAVLRAGVRFMYRIFETPPLSDYDPVDRHPVDLHDDAALDEMIRNRADTVYHPVGTCRMGSDDDHVVDPRLRLRGIDGLYVADASIMPRIVSGNTNAPSIMIGERCAEFVAQDIRTQDIRTRDIRAQDIRAEGNVAA